MIHSPQRWICAVITFLGVLTVVSFGLFADDKPDEKNVADAPVFGLTKLHQIQLEVSAKDYPTMDPKSGGPQFGFGGPPGVPGRAGPGRPPAPQGGIAAAGGFGYEFETVKAKLKFDDHAFPSVGLRYKGNATYMLSARSAKRSFKIDFDEYQADANLATVRKLNLHCGVLDATKARESLAYGFFRAAGIPAPQTSLAEVKLTVPGKFDGELLGLYTVVEQVDKAFLKQHFRSDKGLLLKPEGMRGILFLGDDIDAYRKAYDGKYKVDDQQWKRLIEFAKLINQADDAQFQKEIDSYLDVDSFVRFLAVNSLIVNFDSFIGLGHNYYLYLVPETNKFVFFPWDLDLAFGCHPMFGTMDQQVNMSIEHPHVGEINLIDRLLAIPKVKRAYREELRRLTETLFTDETLGAQISAIEAVTKEPVEREKKAVEARKEGGFGFGPPGAGGAGSPFGGPAMTLKSFIEKRSASVLSQLDGKTQGTTPRPAFGPGGPGGPPGGPGFPGGGLAGMLTRPILKTGDTNNDGKLSAEELAKATADLMKKFDKDQSGLLDEKELEAAINSLLPMPPQFGPPGRP